MPTAMRSTGEPSGALIVRDVDGGKLVVDAVRHRRRACMRRRRAARSSRRSGSPRRAPPQAGSAGAARRRCQATTLTIRLRHDDHLLGRACRPAPFLPHRGPERQPRSRHCGVAADRDFGALLAVDLDRQRQRVLDQKVALDLRPGRFRDQRRVAEHGPAFLGEVRHHRVEQLHENINRFAHGPARSRRDAPLRPIDIADRRRSALANS